MSSSASCNLCDHMCVCEELYFGLLVVISCVFSERDRIFVMGLSRKVTCGLINQSIS